MKRFSWLLLLPVVWLQCGCASTDTASNVPAPDNIDSNGQAVSSVPWNKPESWETSGQMGGMMNNH